MTPPQFFAVDYAINPWMDTTNPVDRGVAIAQWQHLHDVYRQLGHTVDLVEPVPGLPDMVYAANGGLILDGTAVVARFKYPQRQQESVAYAEWLRSHGYQPGSDSACQRGPRRSAAGGRDDLGRNGFPDRPAGTRRDRRDLRASGRQPELVDPRFYHLDTALTVLDDTTIAYYPPAFSDVSRAHLETLFPDAIVVDSADAYVFGLNAVSDGRHVVHPVAAVGFAEQLADAGFQPIGIDLSELLKGGGSVKCCTLEVYS